MKTTTQWNPASKSPKDITPVLGLIMSLGQNFIPCIVQYTKGEEIEAEIDEYPVFLSEGWYEQCEQKAGDYIFIKRDVKLWSKILLPESPNIIETF